MPAFHSGRGFRPSPLPLADCPLRVQVFFYVLQKAVVISVERSVLKNSHLLELIKGIVVVVVYQLFTSLYVLSGRRGRSGDNRIDQTHS